uniref:Uncharacterized protein n=1 Tax=Arion vulgaris TaxID=1028688 RepID=A0A0B6YVQ8_9EUPU
MHVFTAPPVNLQYRMYACGYISRFHIILAETKLHIFPRGFQFILKVESCL